MNLYLNFLNMQKIQLNLSTTATLRKEERRWGGGGGYKEVAVVERNKQESMYGLLFCSPGQKSVCCGDQVAITLVKVLLFSTEMTEANITYLNIITFQSQVLTEENSEPPNSFHKIVIL